MLVGKVGYGRATVIVAILVVLWFWVEGVLLCDQGLAEKGE